MKRLIWAFLLCFGCGNGDLDQAIGDTASSDVPCPFDEDEDAASATTAAFAQEYEGYLCPIGDVDWYRVDVPASSDLLTVKLELKDPVVPVNPIYTIWNSDASAVVTQPAATDAAAPGDPLELTHAIGSGGFYVAVRDRGGDGMDTRHPYAVSFTHAADQDTNEPNNSEDAATPVPASNTFTGYISSWGDEDWFALTIEDDNQIARVNLTMAQSGFQPTIRFIDAEGNVLLTLTNPDGTREATTLDGVQALSTGDTYYLVISDDEMTDADPATPYEVTITVEPDPDTNEPNDHPAEATTFLMQDCASETTIVDGGYLSSNGDADWYRVDLSNCGSGPEGPGVIEVIADFGAAALADNIELSGRFLVEFPSESCTEDQDCQVLSSKTCSDHLDCTKLGNDCLAQGVCAGSGLCLPDNGSGTVCGAYLLTAQAKPTERGTLRFSAPLVGEGVVYVGIEDFHNNAYDVDNGYSLTVNVYSDPDVNENSAVYSAGAALYDNRTSVHDNYAKGIEIYGCGPWSAPPDTDPDTDADTTVDTGTGPPDPLPSGCCESGAAWTTGYLTYMHDQDWFKFPHPCPGQDCMVRVHYDFGDGPVEFYIRQTFGGGWVDNIGSVQDSPNPTSENPADDDIFGGLTGADECSYAYNGHSGDYHFVVRDTVFVSSSNPEGGYHEWSRTQPYSICVERYEMGCFGTSETDSDGDFPCFIWPDGCGLKPGSF